MTATHVFIDTNVALHYRRPNEIDWLQLTGADNVVLVVAPMFVRELEEQKFQNPSRRLRERAAQWVQWLLEYVRDAGKPLRPAVCWHFIGREPMINFEAAHLSRHVVDDRLIASVLDYAPQDGGPVCVATGDGGLEIKLRQRSIAVIPMPDTLLLPLEPDPIEKEVLELRRKVAQQRAPELALTWEDGATHRKISLAAHVTVPSAPSLAEVRQKFPFLQTRAELQVPGNSALAEVARMAARFQASLLSPEIVNQYNGELKEYFKDYERYLEHLLAWEQIDARKIPVCAVLSNQGNAPASQIAVLLTFPAEILLVRESELPERPKPPREPRQPPTSFADVFAPIERASLFNPFEDFSTRSTIPEWEAPDVNAEKGTAEFGIRSLMHEDTLTLEGLYFFYRDVNAACSFEVRYRVSAAELPTAARGSLHIVLDGTAPTTQV